ncbi:50S ribosomal protein L6 [Candidatus Woesearchaeota archaeon CG10_big_fil_rev_8_21_14_0_10_45_16]|nr:MAG: 50S ribosomal protein L6 [Candidatus Woesearchaeota archaeon CG10_big_fil_rev_8_21_14_0_10_45_16]
MVREMELPQGVTAVLQENLLTVKGPKGEVSRDFKHPLVKTKVETGKVVLEVKKGTKREKTIIGSFESHINNMIKGVQEPFVYKLKICSGHFPMNVAVAGQEFVVKNFLGEAVPRRVGMVAGAKVEINGVDVTVTSVDKEKAGLMAARIENLCRITNRDRRIFQDGIYITDKAGKSIA